MKTHRSITYIALNTHYVLSQFIKSLLIPGTAILAASVFQGCDKQTCPQDGDFTGEAPESPVKLAVHNPSNDTIRSMDVLVFNDDLLQRIDCYQRFDKTSEEILQIGSCSGNKIIFLCANSQWGKDDWRAADSFRKTALMKADLEKEDRNHPLMSAEIRTGTEEDIHIARLERLSSTVTVRSICCDFSGRPYDGENITEARIYLTNINGTCSITAKGTDKTERIINHGGLIAQDLMEFHDSTLVINHLGTIGSSPTQAHTELICYPSTSLEDNIGSPFTRLVIEGKIQGETWYWPININRDPGGKGIERNMKYIYDIVLTRKGSKNPDTPISQDMAGITFEAERWNEKEEYHVEF